MKRLMTGFAVAAILLAGTAAARDYFGSIAYSPSTGAYGYTSQESSRRNAENRALNACYEYADDCQTAISYWNGYCGAVARGDRNGWGSGSGPSGQEAQSDALRRCRQYTRNCRVVRWQCAARGR